ncbi:MAG: STAS domain-containing protein [Erythrobacter sp.]|nr:STAS domain-containing protein [Erythrobacter sp.]
MNSIALPATCDRTAAKALYQDMSEALGPAPLAIDASKVERIGQAMLQLLLSASLTEGGIALVEPSEALRETLRLTGLNTLLDEPLSGQAIPSA